MGKVKDLELVCIAKSFTKGNEYEIKRHKTTGDLFCECPAFKFQKRPMKARRCKHIQRFLEDNWIE